MCVNYTTPYSLYKASVPVQYSYTSTPIWAVHPVQSLSACTRVHFTFTLCTSCLHLLPLPSLSTFHSMTCFRLQFLCKMWRMQLAFLYFAACRTFFSSSILCNASVFTRLVQLVSALLRHHKCRIFLSIFLKFKSNLMVRRCLHVECCF